MSSSVQSLGRAQARRIALAAQGFTDPPHAVPTMRTLTRAVQRTGVLQVDSVNVVQRAHLVPLYSRMGGYDVDLLRRASSGRRRRLVEYWAHVQALMPVELWPVMQHRMEHYRSRRHKWFSSLDLSLESSLLAEVRERGACTARDLDDGLPRAKEHWGWNWSETRKVLDYLYMVGELAIAGRNSQFEVRYDLPERVLPPEVLALPTPGPDDAARELVRRAARSHGVATPRCLRDYYRMSAAATRRAVAELTEEGELVPVTVEGRPAYLHRDARLPRRVAARALLSPFDPLVWERERTEWLFGFRYRIEIYVPEAQRVHGYYVLPFLSGDRLTARVDLKADRRALGGAGRLLVRAAYAEADAPPEVAAELAVELARFAGWLGLAEVRVEPRGDLAAPLAAELPSG
ncbi:winged helix-turn-helix domain-containing protein [Nocardioides ferulae]|uniref:winged helix-turn-helix domain-containing protein n=1 Tax=Nocardioides ferulae TaxID=2340821 RepID=UPI000EAEFF05|nr:crosslink repair DNA glycosylase YcaQ family protein [Nocardioides ferulae]